MICLEIFNLIFRCVSKPESLVQRSLNADKAIAQENLNKLLGAEDKKKKLLGRKAVTRHSRFGTTVVIESTVNTSITSKKEAEDGRESVESRRNVLAKDRIVLHKQSAIAHASINPGKILDQGRMVKAKRGGAAKAAGGGASGENESSSAAQVDLTNEALKVLQIVALSFLESAFNRKSPLFQNRPYY
jgi:replication fork protection complex subunit Tof1/Swi1